MRIDHVLGDRPFAEVGDPALVVRTGGLIAIAGARVTGPIPVAVYDAGDLRCRAVVRSRLPVHTMAFHPTSPLLAVGTGRYDGGYFFEGELLLLDLSTGVPKSLLKQKPGRQVLDLEWLTRKKLRVLMAPADDWEDEEARSHGHEVVLKRTDWTTVPAGSVGWKELLAPRIPAPRHTRREAARRELTALHSAWDPRRDVRAVEQLSDGRIVATLDGVQAECRLPSGARQWTVPDPDGGRELAVLPGEDSVWVNLQPPGHDAPQTVVRLSLADGSLAESFHPAGPVVLVRTADGRPALAPGGWRPLRVRRGSRVYHQERKKERGVKPPKTWLAAADPRDSPVPGTPPMEKFRRLFRYPWAPGEHHFAGPGVETADGSLICAGTVHDGAGLQPGGSFVIRRDLRTGEPEWLFRTDRPATDLDAGATTVYVAYDDGEIIALDIANGGVRWRTSLTVAAVPAFPTALTVAGPNRLLIGTSDGRILDCSLPEEDLL